MMIEEMFNLISGKDIPVYNLKLWVFTEENHFRFI